MVIKMKGFNKKILFIGAVLTAVMLLSTITATSAVVSQPLMEQINKKEEQVSVLDFPDENDDFFKVNKDNLDVNRMENITAKIENFLIDNDVTGSDYENSTFYKSLDFQNLLEMDVSDDFDGVGFEEEVYQLLLKVKDDYRFFYNNQGGLHAAVEYVLKYHINPFFTDFFNSGEYNQFSEQFNQVKTDLASELAKEYEEEEDEREDYNFDIDQDNVGIKGILGTELLVSLCTMIFLANWICFGEILGSFTSNMIAGVLAVALVIPCIMILSSDLVIDNVVDAAFEALYGAIDGTVAVFEQIFQKLIEAFRWTGIFAWIPVAFISGLVSLGISPLIFFGTFMVEFYENVEELEPGHVIRYLPELISAVLEKAANRAYDIWDSLFQNTPICVNKPKLFADIRLERLFLKIFEKFNGFELLFFS
jgi:hypothetical protein